MDELIVYPYRPLLLDLDNIKWKEIMRNIFLTPTVVKPFHKQVYDKVTTIRLQK